MLLIAIVHIDNISLFGKYIIQSKSNQIVLDVDRLSIRFKTILN